MIYEDSDGLEFESSYSFIDLRFIPDNIAFDDEPKDVTPEVAVFHIFCNGNINNGDDLG